MQQDPTVYGPHQRVGFKGQEGQLRARSLMSKEDFFRRDVTTASLRELGKDPRDNDRLMISQGSSHHHPGGFHQPGRAGVQEPGQH